MILFLKNINIQSYFFSFIIVENLLLMQHATVYSFYRLKVIFILIIITITKQYKNDKFFATYILIFAMFMAILNCSNYLYKKMSMFLILIIWLEII